MKKTNLNKILAAAMTAMLSFGCLTGCGQSAATQTTQAPSVAQLATGGVLCLRVNPEIAITYDAAGAVTKVESRNEDAKKILESYTGFEGKECRTVVAELVNAIGEAGYFVEEVEGESRQITIEIESGSKLPNETFLDDVVKEVRTCVTTNDWQSPVEVQGESSYGMTNYIDTDYGPDNDGVTNYDDTDYGPGNDGVTDYSSNTGTVQQDTRKTIDLTGNNSVADVNDTDYGPENDGVTDYGDTDYGPGNDGVTDYDDTDYGPNNDGVTDYDDTDYGPNNDGVTDYDDTDYGPNNDGVTDYDDTDYGPNNDGVTDYDDTDYGPNNDGVTDYNDTDYGPNNDGVTDYSNDGASNYDDGGSSNYDDGGSNYDDGGSNYDDGGDSGYDD